MARIFGDGFAVLLLEATGVWVIGCLEIHLPRLLARSMFLTALPLVGVAERFGPTPPIGRTPLPAETRP